MCDATYERGEFIHPCALTDHPTDGKNRVVHLAVASRLGHSPHTPLNPLAHRPVTWTTAPTREAAAEAPAAG
jgi:hypothetical protein